MKLALLLFCLALTTFLCVEKCIDSDPNVNSCMEDIDWDWDPRDSFLRLN